MHQDVDSRDDGTTEVVDDVLATLFDEGGIVWVAIGISALAIMAALALFS